MAIRKPPVISRRQTVDPKRGRRVMGWLVFLLLASSLQALPVRGQIPFEAPPPEESESAESAEQDVQQPIEVEADEIIGGRLAALPVTAQARLMAVQEAISLRREGPSEGVYQANIHGDIELGIAYFIERAVAEAEDADAILLVFDIETPGGRVDAAVMIRDYILNSEVPTIAFVHNRAWSAGALISLANDLIIMTQGASIGAATPIQMGGGGGAEPVEEKVVSALRAEFRSAAEATSRSPDIAESMVDRNIAVGGVIEPGRLLTLTGRESLDVGFSEARAESLDEVLELFDLSEEEVVTIEESWAESLVRVLTSPMISGLLMTLGFLGLFFELTTPGFGWAGAMGLGALVIFFAGHLLVKLAGFEEIALFIAGIVLLGIELFVIPGFGIVGILGLIAIGTSLTLSLIGLDFERIVLSPVGVREALFRVGLSFVVTVVGGALLLKFIPRTRFGQRLVLARTLAAGPSVAHAPSEEISVGDSGTALSYLRPFGRGKFGKKRVEVVSDGELIDKGSTIKVVRVAGNRIEVRAVAPPSEEEDDQQ